MEDEMRESLIEIIGDLPFSAEYDGYNSAEWAEHFADHLIAHGVTFKDVPDTNVGKWVSVKDRLPEIPEGWAENPDPVLYMMKNTKTIYAGYYGEGGMWRDKYFRQYADSRNGVDADDVLCWMYQHDLPQLTKGE